jgi:FixJ family two-component response regulator
MTMQRQTGENMMDLHSDADTARDVRGANVYIVDDDDAFRTGLARVLNVSGLKTVGYRCAGEYLLNERSDSPSCILLDVFMPGPSGIDLLNALATRESSPPVIFITACSDVSTTVHALKSGAVDFLTKPIAMEQLLTCVRNAISLDIRRREQRAEISELRSRYASLTSLEERVFIGIVNGRLNKQLAVALDTCERTIKRHRARVMQKMQVSSLAELVKIARRLGAVKS